MNIQIQSVLFFNSKDHLESSLDSVARAIQIYRKSDYRLKEFTVSYGDSSISPILEQQDIDTINTKYEGIFSLNYRFFSFNSGTAKGHNLLAKECSSQYIMIMNPDILLAPDFFAEIMKPFENEYLKAGLSEARQTPIEHPKDYNKLTGETSWCSTAAAVFPTELFKKVGGFDEKSFFMYCDDVDFSWRIRLLGYRCIYCPSAIIYHAKSLGSNAQIKPTAAEIYYSAEAALIMAYKWSNPNRLRHLLSQFQNSHEPNMKKAADAFILKKSNGELPDPLDSEHKIAEFVGDYYTKHRFVM